MTHFLKFLIVLLFVTSCKSLPNKVSVTETEIRYEAHTRGFFLELILQNKTMERFDHFDKLKSTTKLLSSKQWNELLYLVKEIDLPQIPITDAPSKLRHTDAAAFARLTVITEKDSFKTKYFDHHNPPSLVKPIVEKILSLQEY
jgi:hypothetical protein